MRSTARMRRPTWTVRFEAARLPVWVTTPTARAAKRVLVLAPGAGSAARHPWLDAQATRLAGQGITVVRFDFSYRVKGHKAPDRLPKLADAYRAVVDRVRAEGLPPRRLWLGGKSMGGRVASHVVADGIRCAGLVFYGYPLAPKGRVAPERTVHWPRVGVPALFLTGTRDRLCPLADLQLALRDWPAPVTEHQVRDADHGFAVLKRTGRTEAEVHAELAAAVAAWMTGKGATA